MNIVIIGLGSMGKRRMRLMQDMYPENHIYGVDGREDRRAEAANLYSVECYDSIDRIEKSIDCAFICTSPLSHSSIISECLRKRWHVFTELNLVDDGYEENILLAKKNNCILFLSSTFFYREEIKYIRSKISVDDKWNYIYHIGQYLPDWHPWENYNDFFVGDKRTNGCREIMAIELPWITGTFGDIVDTCVLSDKMTNLNIDYHDNFIILLTHKNGNKGTLIVDVVSPCAVRKLEIYSEGHYLSWNGTPESLSEHNSRTKTLEKVTLYEETQHKDGYQAFIVENAYKNEIKEFFDYILHGKKPLYGFEQDKVILNLIDSIGA